jgi:hypothetical protein
MTRFILLAGNACMVLAVAWKALVSPTYEVRFPMDWSWTFNALGYTDYPEGGQYLDDIKQLDVNIRTVTIESTKPDGTTILFDKYETFDVQTNVNLWYTEFHYSVDRVTGRLTAPYENDYFLFPRYPQKDTTYNITNYIYQNLSVSFVEEVNLYGINTYLYQFKGDYNNYGGEPEEPLAENELIMCFGLEVSYWVEPTLGDVVKFKETCEGDWVVNTVTDEQIRPVSRWQTETSSDDILRQIPIINQRLNTYHFMTLYAPLGLGVLGLGLCGWGAISLRRHQPSK